MLWMYFVLGGYRSTVHRDVGRFSKTSYVPLINNRNLTKIVIF